jgi:hypothetical protein
MMEDEEEAKRRKQRAMKGKRKEAAQLNADGEVRGVPGMGEKTRVISWIWQSAGYMGGAMGEQIYEGVRVEWCKAYARVKRWQEEVLLLQEEMVRCLRTLEWQASIWDARAASEHYTGSRVFSSLHLQGAMAFAARQAAVRRKLATRFRRMWWSLTDKIEGPYTAASSESSGIDDNAYSFAGGNGSGSEDDSGVAEEEEEPEEEELALDGEGVDATMSQEEIASRQAAMDELIAIQSASVSQYDDV